MNNSLYIDIQEAAKYLGLDLTSQEMAQIALDNELTDAQINAINHTLSYLKKKKSDQIVSTLLRLSRLPLKEPKTFENFDFSYLNSPNNEALKSLQTLSALYARTNMAFIGPQGVGKTHLAMAYGRECCLHGMKAYFLKATELNQRLLDARKLGRENAVINSLVKPSCLIIDEIGRCVFDKECTRMFFDIIDRRYNKEGPNTVIITSNTGPEKWGEFFSEDSTILCTMDRIFDKSLVFLIKGDSYRGRKRETIALSAGISNKMPQH